MALIAPIFIEFVMGSKWIGSIVPLQILMIAQLIKSIISTGSSLFLGVGKPKYEFYQQLIRAITLVIFIYPFIKWFNISGASLAVVLSSLMMIIPFLYSVFKITGFKSSDIGIRLLPTLLSSTLMAFFTKYLVGFIDVKSANKIIIPVQLSGVIIISALIYFILFYFICKGFSYITILEDLKIIQKTIGSKLLVFHSVIRKILGS